MGELSKFWDYFKVTTDYNNGMTRCIHNHVSLLWGKLLYSVTQMVGSQFSVQIPTPKSISMKLMMNSYKVTK